MATPKKRGHRGAWTPDIVRRRIQAATIVRRLVQHVIGEIEMSPTQVRAAEILLRKTVPDLSATSITSVVTHHIVQLTDEQLERIAAGSSEGAAEETGSPDGIARIQRSH